MSERRPSTIWRALLFAGMVGSTAGASCGALPEKLDERRGAYLVDAGFVADLEANLSLLENDSAILVESSTGGYYLLANVARGDLADVMGLQSGDVIVSVNGYDLGTVDGQIAAYNNLQGQDEFTLRFERSGRVLSTTYILIGGSSR